MQKQKVGKRSKSSSAGVARVALYQDPTWELVQDPSLSNWGEGFFDFSRPLKMLSVPFMIDGKYDKGFFILTDKGRNSEGR